MAQEEPHPAVAALMAAVQPAPEGGGYTLSAAALAAFQRDAGALAGPELLQALAGAVRFALVLAERKASPAASRALLEAMLPLSQQLWEGAAADVVVEEGRIEQARVRAQRRERRGPDALQPPARGGVRGGAGVIRPAKEKRR